MSRKPAAMTRSPCSPMRVMLACAWSLRSASQGMPAPAERALAALSMTAGAAPLTKQRTVCCAPVPSPTGQKTAISL